MWASETKIQWQPIETAPKDGTNILVFGKTRHGFGIYNARWEADEYQGYEEVGDNLFKRVMKKGIPWWRSDVYDGCPLYWTPMPNLPVSE